MGGHPCLVDGRGRCRPDPDARRIRALPGDPEAFGYPQVETRLRCSWALVAVFIAVLVLAWSYLGASGRIHDDAKSRAETAQQELDTAQSTLADINRQIEEANK